MPWNGDFNPECYERPKRRGAKMLTASDIQVGKLYRAKHPTKVWGEFHNDRVVVWMNEARTRVQYDSKAVPDGRHYPIVDMDKFLKWASHEVQDAQPTSVRGADD